MYDSFPRNHPRFLTPKGATSVDSSVVLPTFRFTRLKGVSTYPGSPIKRAACLGVHTAHFMQAQGYVPTHVKVRRHEWRPHHTGVDCSRSTQCEVLGVVLGGSTELSRSCIARRTKGRYLVHIYPRVRQRFPAVPTATELDWPHLAAQRTL